MVQGVDIIPLVWTLSDINVLVSMDNNFLLKNSFTDLTDTLTELRYVTKGTPMEFLYLSEVIDKMTFILL